MKTATKKHEKSIENSKDMKKSKLQKRKLELHLQEF